MRSLSPRDIASAVALGIWIIFLTNPQVHAMAAWLIGATQ